LKQNLHDQKSGLLGLHRTAVEHNDNSETVLYMTSVSLTRLRGGTMADALRYKAVGSIPDAIIGIYHWHNTSGRTMALGLIQYLTEMSTRDIFWSVMAAGA